MKITKNSPAKSLNKGFLKHRPLRSEIELFKSNLIRLLDKIDEIEREENQKNHFRDFLRDTYYNNINEINTKGTIDLVIHLGKTNKDNVGVIIETKKPGNSLEMISEDKPNVKAFHELVLYYLRERIEENNTDIKYLIATNVYEWYIFEASYFEKFFFRNKSFTNEYEEWRDGKKVTKDTNLFYNDIAKPFLDEINEEFPCTFFDIREYENILRNNDKEDDRDLIALQKLLSPYFLLKEPYANDSNSLNEQFYRELLHIVGLEEVKQAGKNIIQRKAKNRQAGSFIENAINIFVTEDTLGKLKDKLVFGQTEEEQLFGIALELSLTWINRVLFLKLLEGQLITYHKGNKDYRFLNSETIQDFDELYKLFHQVLSRNFDERSSSVKAKYSKVPFLNSSLFEISELEDSTIKINSLDNSETIDLISTTILTEEKKKNKCLPALDYLLKFLDAYDFASEGAEDIAEENRTIINASVLGKVFEKINAYKDGSIFTPGFITMYMSRESLRLAVLQRFNDYFKANNYPEVNTFEELYNRIDKIGEEKANEIMNSLRICDPAVGSGHFLVSVLNELIAIKSELGILIDNYGRRLRDWEIVVDNDELIISDEKGIFVYNYQNKESQRVQETIFKERQTIIENCLFGVDINPISVKICSLRLWIELLKSSFYKAPDLIELETLPNIDINIKCGNSLISRYDLDADLKKALQKSKWNINSYQNAIATYHSAKNKSSKRDMLKLIDEIKSSFKTEIQLNDKQTRKLHDLQADLFSLSNQTELFNKSEKDINDWNKKVAELTEAIKKQEEIIEEIRNDIAYKNAFEWRFEFPEVLDDNGDFVGFDIVIGNPPYIQLQKSGGYLANLLENLGYNTFHRMGDIYALFYEKGMKLLKDDAHLIFISSNKWMRAGYGERLRDFFTKYDPKLLIDLGPNVFESATVDTNILLIKKNNNSNNLRAVTINANSKEDVIINSVLEKDGVIIKKLSKDAWIISSDLEMKIKEKIERIGTPLKDWDIKINYGIKTGYNEAFIIDGKKKDELIAEDPKSAEIIRPILRGRDIKRYSYEFADLYLIATFPSLKIDIEKYPAVKKHLLSFGMERLEQTGKEYKKNGKTIKARKKTTNKWFETQDSISYWEDFYKQKIAWNRIASEKLFSLVVEGFVIQDSMHFFTGNHLKFLCAILNSKLFCWLMYLIVGDAAGGNAGNSDNVRNLPVPKLTPKAQQPFIDLVDKIIEKKAKGEPSDAEERQVDSLVYDLYSLSAQEVAEIEKTVR